MAYTAKVTEAACGASTSSCKACHEVQGTFPVSKKGDWHIQHSFGDFCQACHQGVATETDKTKAHAGVVAKPLAQPDQACASCHPADTATRVAKYGGAATTTPAGTAPAAPVTATTSTDPSAGTAAVTPSAATQVPPSANPNFDILDFNSSGKLTATVWTIIIANILAFLVLLALLWKWKKGVWPWFYMQGRQKNVPFNTLPQEVQDVFNQLLEGDLQTVLAMQEILQRKQGRQLLRAMTLVPEKILSELEI